jgi:FtsP/CotA-like multicopper oxidase with cupredoxin domain
MRVRPWMAVAGAAAIHAVTIGVMLVAFPRSGMAAGTGTLPPLLTPDRVMAGHGGHGGHGGLDPCAGVARAHRQATCEDSLLPPRYPMMAMGTPDYGTTPNGPGRAPGAGPTTSLTQLHGPDGVPDREFTLTAALGTARIGGVTVMTFNGSTPGPALVVRQGDLVAVHLRNANVPRGVTIHWHGVDVPGAEDGVAGVTQDAVLPGQEYTYRFVVPDAGTYWYHTHQDSVRGVGRGLLGAFVALPRDSSVGEVPSLGAADVVAVVHTYGTLTTINGVASDAPVTVPAGTQARVRVVNSDNGPVLAAASGEFTVAAIDGTDLQGGTPMSGPYVLVPAGGRVDLLVPVPPGGVRVGVVGGPTMVLGPSGQETPPPVLSTGRFDPLTYGTPGGATSALAALGPVQRWFTYRVGMRRGYLDGRSGNWYTINGRTIPDVPMMVVHQGEVVRMRISNATLLPHPIHLHGHHVLVVSRNGIAASGGPWWVDSLEVDPGETYDIVLLADNPGVWMFHCHNLPHARTGLMTHLMYAGVSTPYRIGRVSARLVNEPE